MLQCQRCCCWAVAMVNLLNFTCRLDYTTSNNLFIYNNLMHCEIVTSLGVDNLGKCCCKWHSALVTYATNEAGF